MPAKTCDVSAFTCTSAGIDLGSDAGSWRLRAKENVGPIADWVPISDLNWSIAARHSTRAAEIEAVLNSSAHRWVMPATSNEKIASHAAMNRSVLFPKASPPGENPVS